MHVSLLAGNTAQTLMQAECMQGRQAHACRAAVNWGGMTTGEAPLLAHTNPTQTQHKPYTNPTQTLHGQGGQDYLLELARQLSLLRRIRRQEEERISMPE